MSVVERIRLPKAIIWNPNPSVNNNTQELKEVVLLARKVEGRKRGKVEVLTPGDHNITPKPLSIRNIRRYVLGVGGLLSDIVHVPIPAESDQPSVERKINFSSKKPSDVRGAGFHEEADITLLTRFLLKIGFISSFAIRPSIREVPPGEIIPVIEPSFFKRARVREVIFAPTFTMLSTPGDPSYPTGEARPLVFSGG